LFQVQDKIAFAMNNLSSINLETKVKELKALITEEYFSWFANYLVVKRAAQEPNFHPLYLVVRPIDCFLAIGNCSS
jgi:CCR4-NOT transcription complex subunit 1